MNAARTRLTLLSAICLVTWAGYAAADFPFNGGFEQVTRGQPIGWQMRGVWSNLTMMPAQVHRCAGIFGTVSEAGDRLVSSGYRLIGAGEEYRLAVTYQSAAEGAVVGLIPCDALGRPLPEREYVEALPPAATWSPWERTVSLPREGWSDSVAAVRVFVGVDRRGAEARFDALSLADPEETLPPAPAVPSIKALDRPNLLPASAVPGGTVELLGSEGATVWLSDPLVVDGSLPYDFSAQVVAVPAPAVEAPPAAEQPTADTEPAATADTSVESPAPAGEPLAAVELPPPPPPPSPTELTVCLLLRDPQDPANVLLQESVTVTPPVEGGPVALSIVKLSADRVPGLAQVALALGPGSGGANVSQLALRPQPVTLTIRPVAMATEFAQPKDVILFVIAVNNTRETLNPTAHLKVLDAEGQQVCYEARALKIGPQSACYFPYKPTLKGPGEYRQLVRLLLPGGRDVGLQTFDFRVTGEPPPPFPGGAG